MLFNSKEFILLFLPITLIIYFYLNSKKLIELSKLWLVMASLFFYGWWNYSHVLLIGFSILINFSLARFLSGNINNPINFSKKQILITGLLFNLCLLAYYKYAGFALDNINQVMGSSFNVVNIALPLAISFFTFQQITYLIDSYRGQVKKHGLLNYAIFVLFFPQLIAGPIVHHSEMMPQFDRKKSKYINYDNVLKGLIIFSIGLFKKVIIADGFASWADYGFDQSEQLGFYQAWGASLSYTFQLYFDFSGYTDMAIGLALMFNIKLPINFNSPYKAKNIQEFWRRWHITLSRFLRDYIYVPLGGNRVKEFEIYRNLLITFLIGGLWHGAGWTFIVWGLVHGIAIIAFRLWNKTKIVLNKYLAWFITFNFINLSWVVFRANDWNDVVKILKGMFVLESFEQLIPVEVMLWVSMVIGSPIYAGLHVNKNVAELTEWSFFVSLLFVPVVLFLKNSNQLISSKINYKLVLLGGLLFGLAFNATLITSSEIFLYFNF